MGVGIPTELETESGRGILKRVCWKKVKGAEEKDTLVCVVQCVRISRMSDGAEDFPCSFYP